MITSFLPACNLVKLETLKLCNNEIYSIPRHIENLKNLTELFLRDNNICVIPEKLYELKKLRVLDLGSNLIPYIPYGLSKLEKLEILNFRCNPLHSLPADMQRLKHLETIDFTETKLPLDLQTRVMNDGFVCQMYGVDAAKRFGSRMASNAAAFMILAMRKYPEKGCDYFAALDERTVRQICEMVLESGVREEKEWERVIVLMEKKMVCQEVKKVDKYTTNTKEEDCYDREDWMTKVKDGMDFEDMGRYDLALKLYKMALDVRASEKLLKKIQELEQKEKKEI